MSQDYQGFGKRYSCSYELNLVLVSPLGELVTFATIAAQARDAGSTDLFYLQIRDQLRSLPACY
jgi:hypothetical protein